MGATGDCEHTGSLAKILIAYTKPIIFVKIGVQKEESSRVWKREASRMPVNFPTGNRRTHLALFGELSTKKARSAPGIRYA
jgi:hypothetical protein